MKQYISENPDNEPQIHGIEDVLGGDSTDGHEGVTKR